MVEMSGFKIPSLPPSIQRFGRCGGDEAMEDVRSHTEGSSSSSRRAAAARAYPSSASSVAASGSASATTAPTDRVKSFLHGVVSPFTSCLQPTVSSCVSGGAGCGPDYSSAFRKTPAVAVVSPLVERNPHHPHHPPPHHHRAYPPPPHHHYPPPVPHGSESYRDSRLSPASVGTEEERSTTRPGDSNTKAADATTVVAKNASGIPTDNIEQPHARDVLCGRGGSSNRHLGNIHFRELVAANKKTYVGLTKKQKMMLARQIVDVVKSTDPSGRFLAKDMDTGLFYDIGLPRSLEKTSQALREKNSNDVPHDQLDDNEGVETSVEAYQSIVKKSKEDKEETSDSTKQVADESSESCESTKPPKKSPKNVESPPLIIPQNLMHIYGPEKERRRERDAAMSPSSGPQPVAALYHHGSPYHSPYGNHPRGPPTPPHAYGPPPHHRHPAYPPTSPPGAYPEHSRYYYHPHYSPHTPPYRHYAYTEDRRHHPAYAHQPMDKREAYNEYYSKSAERESPNRADARGPPAPPHAPPPHYGAHGYPPAHPLAAPAHHDVRAGGPPPLPPPGYGRTTSYSSAGPVSPPGYRPSPYYGHHSSHYHHHSRLPPPPPAPAIGSSSSSSSNPPPSRDGSSKVIYRTPSNGYVRGNSEVSPERQREIKRQRNVDGHIRRVSESSLSSAVRNSLTLEERVVGRERQGSTASSSATASSSKASSGAASTSSTATDLTSPSSILQSRSRRSMDGKDSKRTSSSSNTFESKPDYSALSGLAALSTAAFLKLDEEK